MNASFFLCQKVKDQGHSVIKGLAVGGGIDSLTLCVEFYFQFKPWANICGEKCDRDIMKGLCSIKRAHAGAVQRTQLCAIIRTVLEIFNISTTALFLLICMLYYCKNGL